MKVLLLAVFVCLISLFALIPNAQAQATCGERIGWSSCSVYSLWFSACVPPLPKGAFNCSYEGGWTTVCEVVTNTCLAPPAVCTKCQAKQGVPKVPTAASPINLTSGNTYIEEQDLRLPGLGGGITIDRNWNSILPTGESAFPSGMFGLHWRSNYEERVFQGSGEASGYIAYLQGDGSLWYFTTSGVLASPTDEIATLTQNGTQTWTITFKNGAKKIFDYTSGSLVDILDPNGNSTALSYDSAGRLTTVTDPAGRHLYFSYANGSSFLVTSITSDFGVSLAYSYDPQGRLTQVTEPDQSTLNFQYDAQSLISTVLDSDGKTLETHTYDSVGRGLTSARADGVDAVTVTYPQ